MPSSRANQGLTCLQCCRFPASSACFLASSHMEASSGEGSVLQWHLGHAPRKRKWWEEISSFLAMPFDVRAAFL